MQIRVDDHPSQARVISLSGHLDASSQQDVVSVVRSAFESGIARVILDFQDVAFFTSTGVAAVMSLYAKARALGGDIVLMHGPDTLEAMFTMLDLNEVYLARDLDDALSRFEKIEQERHDAIFGGRMARDLASPPSGVPLDDGAAPTA